MQDIDVEAHIERTQNGSESSPSSIARDYWPTNGWRNSTPEERGMDSSKLEEMLGRIEQEDWSVSFIIVIKDGYLVFEHFFHRLYRPLGKIDLFSSTRSVTAAVFGIAVEQGYINNLSQSVLDFFPDRTIDNMNSWKESITLENLLTMTSGFGWDEWTTVYGSSDNSYTQMRISRDWTQYILDLPMDTEPGTAWNFCGGDSQLLTAIIENVTDSRASDFAEEHLFTPMNITDFRWLTGAGGVTNGAGGLQMTPHDMAKYGFLYLNNGTWDGNQIIPEEWVQRSLEPQVEITEEGSYGVDSHYGYHWWMHDSSGVCFTHRLIAGRNIFIDPEHDIVVVMACSTPQDYYPQEDLLYEYILGSLIEGVPLTLPLELLIVVGGVAAVVVVLFGVRVKRG
ncbi:MAG: serine hydrolase [Candidatus Thorarchaeota archaeon]|nr:MAG: serine hydrolase [Candidatus Thorarchaeota archaeon]